MTDDRATLDLMVLVFLLLASGAAAHLGLEWLGIRIREWMKGRP